MSDAHVCTLFEGHYHYGLAALSNSLYASGFGGVFWIGYRGELPRWVDQLEPADGNDAYVVGKRFKIVFVKLDTSTHFTLYKPNFMLQIVEERCSKAKCLFYFDPDIVVKAKWSYFENWATHGIALCEDVNSPLSVTSPLRGDWRRYLSERGIVLVPKDDVYVNGGFIGLTAENFAFLRDWGRLQDLIAPDLPAMDCLDATDRSHIFNKLDQDALNIPKDLTESPIAIANKEAMDFSPGGAVMSHAVGRPKPWEKNFLKSLFVYGNRPSAADRRFFSNTRFPIEVYRSERLKGSRKRVNLWLSLALSRIFAN